MALYTETVMDHFMHPRNVGSIDNADGVGEVGNAKCGDIMKMYLKIKDGVIEDVKFETFGCGSAIASSSIATEMIKGKTIDEALALTNKDVVDALGGLPAHKLHCSVLAEEAIKSAVKDYYDRNGIAYDHSKFPDCESCALQFVKKVQKDFFDKLPAKLQNLFWEILNHLGAEKLHIRGCQCIHPRLGGTAVCHKHVDALQIHQFGKGNAVKL